MQSLLILCYCCFWHRLTTHVDLLRTKFNSLLWNLNGFATENKYLSRTVATPLKPSFRRMLYGGNYAIEVLFPDGQSEPLLPTSVLTLKKTGLRVSLSQSCPRPERVWPNSPCRNSTEMGTCWKWVLWWGGQVVNFVTLNCYHLFLIQY